MAAADADPVASGEEDEGDEEDVELLKKLEEQLAANPADYNTHVQYISALRKSGELEKVRAARESMNALYPLTPDMWREWTKDETRLVQGEEDFERIKQLYERAVQDYLCVPLWVDYLEFVEEHDPDVASCEPEGMVRFRELCERALAAAGLHFTEGSLVWTAYRDFEDAVLPTLEDASDEDKAKQLERVKKLFWRQLRTPLADHAETLEAYKDWASEAGEPTALPPDVQSEHKKAVKLVESRLPYEQSIMGKPADAALLSSYLAYIAFEESAREPSRVQILYERALADFPVTHDLWLRYGTFVETQLKAHKQAVQIYARAVRNCPWVPALWERYLLALERSGESEETHRAVFEAALGAGLQATAEDYQELFLTRATALRRRLAAANVNASAADRDALRGVFTRAGKFLAEFFPDWVDRSFQLERYWADVEIGVNGDAKAAEGVWEGVLKVQGHMVEPWAAFVEMERGLKNFEECRKLFRRVYGRGLEGNGTEAMCLAWLQFEKEVGTLDDFDRASAKVGPRLTELRTLQQQREAKAAAPQPTPHPTETARGKPKPQAKAPRDGLPPKRKRGLGFKDTQDDGGRPKKHKEEPQPAAAAEVPAAGANGQAGPPAAGADVSMTDAEAGQGPREDGAAGPSGEDGEPRDGAQEGGGKKRPVYSDQRTAFLKNLPWEAEENDVAEFFAQYGPVKGVRLPIDKRTGRKKGVGYVEFESDEGLSLAIEHNQVEFRGRKLSVEKSDPSSYQGPQQPRGRGRGALGRGGQGRGPQRGCQGGWANPPPPVVSHRRGGHLQLVGDPTAFIPRNIKGRAGQAADRDETPKTNEDFRNLFKK